MNNNITFGIWLRHRRQQLGLTQKELAYQADCSVGTIRKIEADERRPSRQLATLLAQHLDIPSEEQEAFIAFARMEHYAANIALPISLIPPKERPLPQVEVSVPLVKNNLPTEMTPFLGRDAELAAIEDLFKNLDRRLVTIVGPGGIGKTRLALAYAEQLVGAAPPPQYPNGVFFINLAPLPAAKRLILTLAETFGLRIQGGTHEKQSPKQQLLDYMRNRRLLLLLDNFEHLLSISDSSDPSVKEGGEYLVAEILQAAPEVHILVTSRERLNLHMEQVFPIEGLTVPDWETSGADGEIGEAMKHTAVQLFLDAAQRSQPAFSVDTYEELDALVQICHLVSGMPLALELAASWVDTLSLMDIVTELKHGLNLLEKELRDMPERHRSVRATFDYSWQKLDESEQSIFAQLSIFRGGFTRPAAQSITGATLGQLSILINKSFLQLDKQRERYQVHELLRQFGAEQLRQDVEQEASARARHSTYYCHFLERHTNALKGSGQMQAIVTIKADIENVRLAWNHALTHLDLAAISSSQEALRRFYWNIGWFSQGENELERAIASLRGGEAGKELGITLGRLLASSSRFYGENGRREKGREVAEESLELLQGLDAREDTVTALLFLTVSQDSRTEFIRLAREGLALAREFDDHWAIGSALLFLGSASRTIGDYNEAEKLLLEAYNQFKKNDDLGGKAWSLSHLSQLAVDRGHYEEALTLAQDTMTLAKEHIFGVMGPYTLGVALYAVGAYKEARAQFQECLTIQAELGNRMLGHIELFFLGRIAYHLGDFAGAARQHQDALALALEYYSPVLLGLNHDALGRLYLADGAITQARKQFQAALKIILPLDRPPLVLATLMGIVDLFAEEGDLIYAAQLAMLIATHSASQAKIKERAARLLTRLEAELPADELATIRLRSRQNDLDTVAAQLLKDLKSS